MSGWVAGAVVVGGLASSAMQADAAGDAADAQKDATQQSIAEDRRQFDLTREDYAPYREAGANALQQLVGQMNTTPSAADVMSDPGYQFGLQQGQLGLDRKAAAMGGRVSGAALRAASRYNNSYASSGYGAAYQRGQDRLNRLASLAGVGQTATNSSAQAGQAATASITGALQSQGDASAASSMAKGNIWGNATNQLAALYGKSAGAGATGSSGWSAPSYDSLYSS